MSGGGSCVRAGGVTALQLNRDCPDLMWRAACRGNTSAAPQAERNFVIPAKAGISGGTSATWEIPAFAGMTIIGKV